jgi:hypothetical protein
MKISSPLITPNSCSAEKLTIFIDFDGVFHPTGACTWLESERAPHFVSPFRWWPQFRDALKPLDGQVELVVHSTWRHIWESDAELFAHLPSAMRSMTVGCTSREYAGRGPSIDAYVQSRGLTHYVIVDDEPNAFGLGDPHLVVCQPSTGMSDEDVQANLYLKVKAALTAMA